MFRKILEVLPLVALVSVCAAPAAVAAPGDYDADPAGGGCQYVPNGALGGGDLLNVLFRIRTSGTVPPRLVEVRGTSDTGLFTEFRSGWGGSGYTAAQFTLRAGDFGRFHVITIVVDPDDEFAETDEANNRVTARLTLPSPRPTSTIAPLPCTIVRGA
ncbi:hypothetical protein [Saccharothrix coeruleofusca]|nr:hypothetical protein [Saccharothrix coeruleofusca]MBP2336119.1 hypothetical protein [Saccharothrix coeruleofusca]